MTNSKLRWTTALTGTTAALAMLWWGSQAFPPQAFGQLPATGTAEGFEATEYHPEPNHTQLMLRIKAEKVEPQEGGKLLLSGMSIEVFHTNGLPAFAVQAPQCSYDFAGRTANSTGKLSMASGDNRLRVAGEGFEFRQKEMTLNISNRVRTEIRDLAVSRKRR